MAPSARGFLPSPTPFPYRHTYQYTEYLHKVHTRVSIKAKKVTGLKKPDIFMCVYEIRLFQMAMRNPPPPVSTNSPKNHLLSAPRDWCPLGLRAERCFFRDETFGVKLSNYIVPVLRKSRTKILYNNEVNKF